MSDDQSLNLEEQERNEILEEIDELVAHNRIPDTGSLNRLKPQKSGAAFPVIINLLAVAAVVSTFYFSNRLFEQRQEDLNLENATYKSAEGKLLEELKRESNEKLQQKDQEINAIHNELAELDRQSRELAESMDEQIAEREAVLRQALEAELEAERQKLQAAGRSETDIAEQLRQIEAQRSAEHDAELNAFRARTEEQIAEKEAELALAKQLNQELLAEVNSEKQRIQNETRQRETELTAQFEAEKAALAEEAAVAEAQLEALTADRARESLIIDQINSSYESIFEQLDAGNSEEALNQINALRTMIEDPAVATLAAVNNRNSNDRNMIELLKQKIEEQSYKDDVDTKSLAAAADLLLSAQEIAGLGSEAYNAGDTAAATDYYTRSLQKIPALKQAWQNLEQISRDNETERLNRLLSEGRSLEQDGLTDDAAAKYAEAAAAAETHNPALVEQAVSGLLSSSSASGQNKLAAAERDWTGKLAASDTEIDRLTRLIGERDQENLRMNSELTEAKTAITEKDSLISELQADAEAAAGSLQAELDAAVAANEAAVAANAEAAAEHEAALAETAAELLQVQTELDTAAAEIERLNASLTEAEQLEAALAAGESETLTALRTELDAAQTEYAELETKYNQQQENMASQLRASEMTGYGNGVTAGRSAAMEDILELASYFDGTEELDSAARSKIADLSADDDAYSEAVRKIQTIAEIGAGAADITGVKQSVLIGSVSYASGNQIVIEPLTDIDVESGTRITITRIERGQQEAYITFGVITSASAERISARTDPAGTVQARSLDLVYIEQ